MSKITVTISACAAAAALPLVLAAPVHAAPTAAADLVCDGGRTVSVTGFGRGQVLQVVGSTERFVVTRAETGGSVVFDAPGQAGKVDVVRCTTTTPLGRAFTFFGFFTPRA